MLPNYGTVKEGGEKMIITKKKIVSAIAASALILNTFASSALAATTIEISGNGSNSDNDAQVNRNQDTTVVQTNNAYVKNNVTSTSSTGGNRANDNTGGDVTIATGNARTSVDLSTRVNLNHADVNTCDCEGDAEILISGNGADSDNTAKLNSNNDTSVFQTNDAHIKNNVDADAKTGYNDANRNTGGDVTVLTGHATTDVAIENNANANIASVGGSGSGSNGGTMSARIVGNGAYSYNDIELNQHRSVALVQDNDAYIKNNVDATAKTGKNDANDNTGGDVVIDTGSATTTVEVDNLANFNAADVDCGCLTDVDAKVSGNGSYSENDVRANFHDNLDVFQDNDARLKNYVDARAKTGANEANRNTGDVQADPAIITGHATTEHTVSNEANANLAGSEIPEVHFDFDLGELWSSFSGR